jgi:hypothetical protein
MGSFRAGVNVNTALNELVPCVDKNVFEAVGGREDNKTASRRRQPRSDQHHRLWCWLPPALIHSGRLDRPALGF